MTLPVIYIGRNRQLIEHFSRLEVCHMIHIPDVAAAGKLLGGYRRKYVIVLYEKTDTVSDIPALPLLHSLFDAAYIILVADRLSAGERNAYLEVGVNSALPPDTDAETFRRTLRILSENRSKLFSAASVADRRQTFRIPTGKRLFDIAFSGAALLMLSPLLLAVAAAIRLESRGPVIYKSKRVGSNYQVFDFLKFRSMYLDADKHLKKFNELNQYTGDGTAPDGNSAPAPEETPGGEMPDEVMLVSDDFVIPESQYISQVSAEQKNAFVKLENDPRITRVGRFIRKYSIDELPQLINIFKGDMSVVGNRPLPLYEAELLTNDEYIDRFMCPAGLTGLWQVEKRGEAGKLSAEERKQLDIEYAQHFSPLMDLKILLKTFTAFIQKENV